MLMGDIDWTFCTKLICRLQKNQEANGLNRTDSDVSNFVQYFGAGIDINYKNQHNTKELKKFSEIPCSMVLNRDCSGTLETTFFWVASIRAWHLQLGRLDWASCTLFHLQCLYHGENFTEDCSSAQMLWWFDHLSWMKGVSPKPR